MLLPKKTPTKTERLYGPKAPASVAKEESELRIALISVLYSNQGPTFFWISLFLTGKSEKEKIVSQDICKLHNPYTFL